MSERKENEIVKADTRYKMYLNMDRSWHRENNAADGDFDCIIPFRSLHSFSHFVFVFTLYFSAIYKIYNSIDIK